MLGTASPLSAVAGVKTSASVRCTCSASSQVLSQPARKSSAMPKTYIEAMTSAASSAAAACITAATRACCTPRVATAHSAAKRARAATSGAALPRAEKRVRASSIARAIHADGPRPDANSSST